MMAGEIDAAGSAQLYQDVITKWREANPDALANFESWLGLLSRLTATPRRAWPARCRPRPCLRCAGT